MWHMQVLYTVSGTNIQVLYTFPGTRQALFVLYEGSRYRLIGTFASRGRGQRFVGASLRLSAPEGLLRDGLVYEGLLCDGLLLRGFCVMVYNCGASA